MKLSKPDHLPPVDAQMRKDIKPVICYPTDALAAPPMDLIRSARKNLERVDHILVPPREASCIAVKAGQFFRIVSQNGPQVGDLNLWNAHNLDERFYAGKTRALNGTHVSTSDRLWSSFPYLRPLATISCDTLDWYGFDAFGGSVHDVIGTRCDPYTAKLLAGQDYHHCCHSNLCHASLNFLCLFTGCKQSDSIGIAKNP